MRLRLDEKPPLPAKLVRPEPRNFHPRTRLFERIDSARQSPVVWLSAPAGAGKTVLASSYIQARNLPHLWYQIDERDEDAATLFHFLSVAARQHAQYLEPLPPLTPEYFSDLKVYARRFFEGLYQRIRSPAVLVFDNYQDVSETAVLHVLLRDAASILPSDLNLMVISRSHPPPAFARLCLHQDVTVLGWKDLRLTCDEAHGIARLHQGGGISPERVTECFDGSGGWTAGLILLLEGNPQAGIPVGEIDRDRLFDYFAGEILRAASPQDREILLQTALLPHVTAAWAVQLTGRPEAGEVLESLHRRNFFLLKRREGEIVYEFHPLFRDFLREWARRNEGKDAWRESMNRCAEVLAENRLYEEAVELYREAANHEGLVRLLLEQAGMLMTQGRHRTVQTWLGALPEGLIEANAWLLYWQGMASFSTGPSAARAYFERAFEHFEKADDPNGLYLTWAAAVETIFTDFGDFKGIDVWLDALERLQTRYPVFPTPQIEMRVLGALVVQLYRAPDDPRLDAWATRGLELMASAKNPADAIVLINFLHIYYLWKGDLRVGLWMMERMQPHLAQASPFVRLFWYMMHSVLAAHLGDTHAALAWASAGITIAEDTGVHVWDSSLYAQGMYASLIAGDLANAQRCLDDLARVMRPAQLLEHSHYCYLAALLHQQQGDSVSALAEGRLSLLKAKEAGSMFVEMLIRASLALPLFQQGADEEAEEHLRLAENLAERTDSRWLAFLCAQTRAQVAMERGLQKELDDHLRTALAIAREAGGPMAAWCGPKVMARLYAMALEAGIETDYVRGIIRRTALTSPDRDCDIWPWPIKVYTLGRFAVLRDETPICFTGKAQRKPLMLLMALIALGGREVPASELADALWPDAEGDASYRALVTNLQRLRQLLERPDAILLTGTHLSVNRAFVWVDCWAFERLLNRSAEAQREGEHELALDFCEKAMRLYHRPFLNDVTESWAHSRRARLTAKFRLRVIGHCEFLESEGRYTEAISCCLRALEADENAEVFYDQLANLYGRLGREADARAAVDRGMNLKR